MFDTLRPASVHTNLVVASESRLTEADVKIDPQMKRLIERLGELIGRALAEKQSDRHQT
jgi:hypothetical protein